MWACAGDGAWGCPGVPHPGSLRLRRGSGEERSAPGRPEAVEVGRSRLFCLPVTPVEVEKSGISSVWRKRKRGCRCRNVPVSR